MLKEALEESVVQDPAWFHKKIATLQAPGPSSAEIEVSRITELQFTPHCHGSHTSRSCGETLLITHVHVCLKVLAQFLPLALSAYSTQEELERETEQRQLQLLYHDATTEVP